MKLTVCLARLLRKRPLDLNKVPINSEDAAKTLAKTSNSPLIVGYFIGFAYAVLLAPSNLPAIIFIACIASLLSELCKYEFLTCQRGTSPCPYICTYQLLGELPAYLHGWIQILDHALQTSLIARGLGSVFVSILGERLARHHLIADFLVQEDIFGTGAQVVVTLLVLCGLQLTKCMLLAVKMLLLVALTLFVSMVICGQYESDTPLPGSFNIFKEEPLLLATAFVFIAFKPDNREPKLQPKTKSISIYVGVNHCTHLLAFIVMSVAVSFKSIRNLTNMDTSSPLLDILISMRHGTHWSVAASASLFILIGALTLVESIQDAGRHVTRMASDGLVLKMMARKSAVAVVATLCLSLAAETAITTFNSLCLLAFGRLSLDSMTGLVVTYRRLWTANCLDLVDRWKRFRQRFRGYQHPTDSNVASDDSDETDIDAAVDEYRTQMHVSTITCWSGTDTLNHQNAADQQSETSRFKIQMLLFICFVLMVPMSVTLRTIGQMDPVSITIGVVCFVSFVAILFFIRFQPTKIGTSSAIFKVPCVPWISIGSSFFLMALLFQLPIVTWAMFTVWIVTGLLFYGTYGYSQSRLKVQKRSSRPKIPVQPKLNQSRLKIPQVLSTVVANSVAVYPQVYHNLT